MLTEDQARDLLRRAAATIEVDPTAPLPVPVRSRWLVPAVVAAAAVLAAVVGGILVTSEGGEPRPDVLAPAPTTTPTASPTETPALADPTAVKLADQVILFASGGSDNFPGSGSVRFYNEGLFWDVLTPEEADDPSSYSYSPCSLSREMCTVDHLASLRLAGGHTVVTQLPSCYDPDRLVGQGRGGGTQTALVVSRTNGGCDGAIQLRYDNPNNLVAVNAISTTPDPDRDLREVADRFIAFARGTLEAPPVDTPLDLYQDQVLVRTLSSAEAAIPASYRDCGITPCNFSAVERIREVTEVPALRASPDVPACLAARGNELTPSQTGATRSVLITDVDAPCAWGVQFWINDVDQIVALDLRTGARG